MNPVLLSAIAVILIGGGLILNLVIIKSISSKGVDFLLRLLMLFGMLVALLLIIDNARTIKKKFKPENEKNYIPRENQ